MRRIIGQWTQVPNHQIGNWKGTFKYSLPVPCDNVMALVHADRFEQAAKVIVLEVYNYDKFVEIKFRIRRFGGWKISNNRAIHKGSEGITL